VISRSSLTRSISLSSSSSSSSSSKLSSSSLKNNNRQFHSQSRSTTRFNDSFNKQQSIQKNHFSTIATHDLTDLYVKLKNAFKTSTSENPTLNFEIGRVQYWRYEV